MAEMINDMIAIGVMALLFGMMLSDMIIQRRARKRVEQQVERTCKRDMEDTLRLVGLGARKEDR